MADAGQPIADDGRATVFANAKVFDGTDFLAGAHDVVVRNSVIEQVRPSADASTDRSGSADDSQHNTVIIDCNGSTLTPGFIDTHVHFMTSSGISLTAFADPFSLSFYRSTQALRQTLTAGITTARDASGADRGMRAALDEGAVDGPRIRISISLMSQTGGHGDGTLPSGIVHPMVTPHPGRPSGIVDGPTSARRVVRTLLAAGADQIKICTTGGVLSPSDDPRHSQFTDEEVRVIVEEAETQDRYVMAHAQGTPGVIRALRAGVRSIEHGIYLTEEAIQLFLDRDAYLVPTLQAPLQVIRNAEAGAALMPAVVEKARMVVESHSESIRRAHEAGVKIAMGTDAGVGPHGHNLEELELLNGVGLSTVETLRATTSTAAELMRLHDIGRVAVGAQADLLVISGDVERTGLSGIEGRVAQVWQRGRRYR